MKLHPPQSPLSISWLGEAKTAWKAAKARPSQAMVAAPFQKRHKVVAAQTKKPGARAASKIAKIDATGATWKEEADGNEGNRL